jgi:hypothetical protein
MNIQIQESIEASIPGQHIGITDLSTWKNDEKIGKEEREICGILQYTLYQILPIVYIRWRIRIS